MRVLILGGNGQTGRLVVNEALARALVRDPSTLIPREHLTTVKGTPLNERDVDQAFDAVKHDPPVAIITTLNTAPTSPPHFMVNANANAVAAMQARGIRKIIIMQAHGVGDSFPNLFFVLRWVFRHTRLAAHFEDHDSVDKNVKESGLDYVLARPTRLTDGDAGPIKFFGNQGVGIGSFAGISRKTVAAFLVDAVENNAWDRSTPVIAN